MPAPRSQKRASANASTASARRGSSSRSSAHGRSGSTTRSRAGSPRASRSGARTRSAAPVSSGARRTRRRAGGTLDPRVATAAIVASLLIAAWTVYPVLRIQYQQEREARTLAAELEGLKGRNAELREQVDALQTPEGVEQLARESLGLVKPGEQAYIVSGTASDEASASAYGAAGAEGPLAERVLDFIFGFE